MSLVATRQPAGELPTIVIRPSRRWLDLRFGELWDFRELCYFLIWRDIKVRYKQTFLGGTWAVLQPFLLMVVFAVFLGRLGHLPSNGKPYPIFAYAALVPWTLFASGLTGASESLVSNAALVSKIYFPRLLMPIAAVLSPLVDFAIALSLLFLMMLAYGVAPTAAILWLPLLLVLAIMAAFSVGVWIAALNVRYRDFRYTVPFLIQVWLFATPVAYASTLIPHSWRALYGLNPMAGVVEGFRWALLGTHTAPGPMIAVSAAATLVLLVGGLAYFQRVERTFADVI